jgi:uncharacterized delta-60 repeat protein
MFDDAIHATIARAILPLLLAMGLFEPARSAEGDPDVSFATQGARRILLGPEGLDRGRDRAYAVAEAPDGGLWIGGVAGAADDDTELALARLDDDGELVPAFGGDGSVTLEFPAAAASFDVVTAVTTVESGVMALATLDLDGNEQRLVVAKLGSSGQPDPGFAGTGAMLYRPAATRTRGAAMIARSGDAPRWLAAGEISNGNRDVLLVQFDANGALDPAFGVGGVVRVAVDQAFGAIDGAATVAEVDGGTTLLVGGYAVNAQGDVDLLLVKLSADGRLDADFGDGGILVVDLSDPGEASSEYVTDLAPLGDGRVALVATRVPVGEFRSRGVVCFLALDESLSCRDGLGVSPLGQPQIESVFALDVDDQDRLLVGGVSLENETSASSGFVVRVVPGSLPTVDPSWGDDGVARAVFPGVEESSDGSFQNLLVDRRGRVVAVGDIEASGIPVFADFGVARFAGSGVFVDGFE